MSQSIVLGIELSASAICMGLVQEEGQLLAQISFKHPTAPSDLPALLWQHADGLLAKVRQSREVLSAVGVSAVSHISYVQLAEMFRERLGVPCLVTHTGNAAALAEIQYGMATHWQDFVAIALDADLQCGIVTGGALVVGEHGLAGGLGHMLVASENGHERLVDFVSEGGIRRTALKLMSGSAQDSILRDYSFQELTASHVIQAALEKDKLALGVFYRLGEVLGLKLSDVIHHFSPEAVVCSSALPEVPELLLQATKEHMDKNTLEVFRGKTALYISTLNPKEASVRSASAVAWHALANQQNRVQ